MSDTETLSYEYSQQYMEELRKLLGFQYYFLSRVYARSGELPSQSLDQNLAEVDQLLAEVFSNPLTQAEREGALASLEIFFEAARSLSEEQDEFPRFDDVWVEYETQILCEAGEEPVEFEEDYSEEFEDQADDSEFEEIEEYEDFDGLEETEELAS
jgi:hypothetical protein